MNNIESKLLEILQAKCGEGHYVENIRYLLNSNVLTKEEERLCEEILKQIEVYGKFNLLDVLKKLNYDLIELADNRINYAEMFIKIDEIIYERLKKEYQEITDGISKDVYNHFCNEGTVNAFLNQYANHIKVCEDYDFESLSELKYEKIQQGLSIGNEYVDEATGGMQRGSITTIVGTYDDYKSMWALNVAYKALKENQNVLYISLGARRYELYKRFLSRHSCDRKFPVPISVEELNSQVDEVTYNKVYNDFDTFFREKLIVFDNEEFSISTPYSLQKLIVYAQRKFMERTNKGIDLIIIDNFSNIQLDNGKRIITNKGKIISEYFKYLKNQASSLLGTGLSIPILVSANSLKYSITALENGCDFNLDFVDNEFQVLSDIILSIYGDEHLNRAKNVKLKVLKSAKEVMKQSKMAKIDYFHWHIKYGTDNNDDEKHKDELIGLLEKDNKKLKEDNDKLDQDVWELGRQVADLMMPSKSSTLENDCKMDIFAGGNQPDSVSSESKLMDLDDLLKGL